MSKSKAIKRIPRCRHLATQLPPYRARQGAARMVARAPVSPPRHQNTLQAPFVVGARSGRQTTLGES
eukprot:scaffold128207_cov48-Phaeocystis_antarctica.AAC.1